MATQLYKPPLQAEISKWEWKKWFEDLHQYTSDISLSTLGVTATAAELNYVSGVTSAIQTQLGNKQPLDTQLTDIAALAVTDGGVIVGNGTTFVLETGTTLGATLASVIIPQYEEKTASFNAAANGRYLITGNSVTMTMPTGFAGMTIHVAVASEVTGAAVDPGGEYINNNTPSSAMSLSNYNLSPNKGYSFQYVTVAGLGAAWYIVSGG